MIIDLWSSIKAQDDRLLFRWGLFLVFGLLLGVWLAFPKEPGVFPLDDSYIHLSYVRNLAETGTLSFNPGELSTGSSSPLWVVVLTPFYWVGLDIYWTVLAISLILLVLLTYLVITTVRDIAVKLGFTQREAISAALFAGLLLALNGNIFWLALSGMETLLFLTLGLITILVYARIGFGYLTGVLCGLVILTHPSGGALPVTLVLFELANKRWLSWLRGAIAMAIVLSPYLAFLVYVNGDIVPTTGQGKTITYVHSGLEYDQMWHFVQEFFVYQKFLTQHILLLIIAGFVAMAVLFRNRRGLRTLAKSLLGEHSLLTVLVVWGILHFALFMVTFRILLHHTRYLANEYIIWAVLGSLSLLFFYRIKSRIPFGPLLGLGSLGLAASTMFFWSGVYGNDVKHVDEAYIRMGEWINQNTPPDSKIAAFDIGVLRFVGDRETVDLGGLVDPEAHPCLERRDCGEYVREKEADYILYSRNPDVDVFPALFLAEYQSPCY